MSQCWRGGQSDCTGYFALLGKSPMYAETPSTEMGLGPFTIQAAPTMVATD
jgi:hypothetical protein